MHLGIYKAPLAVMTIQRQSQLKHFEEIGQSSSNRQKLISTPTTKISGRISGEKLFHVEKPTIMLSYSSVADENGRTEDNWYATSLDREDLDERDGFDDIHIR